MKKIIIAEFSPLVLFVVSIILSILLTGFGLIHLVIKSMLLTFQKRFWIGPVHFILYWVFVAYQIWNVIKFFFMQSAIAVDLLGNVTTGEAIEDCVTAQETTMYGRGDITISTATGELEYKGKLNKLGIKFTKVLSTVLDKNHCVVSYQRYLHNQTFKLQ